MTEEKQAKIVDINRQVRGLLGSRFVLLSDNPGNLDRPEDLRTANRWCRICLGTVHPQRSQRLRSGEIACGLCARLAETFEVAMSPGVAYGQKERVHIWNVWRTIAPHEEKRLAVIQEFDLDPVTKEPERIAVEYSALVINDHGEPAGFEFLPENAPTIVRPRPRMSWDVLRSRGQV